MTTAQEVIDLALSTNKKLVDRSKSNNDRMLIQQSLREPTQIQTSTSSLLQGSSNQAGGSDSSPYDTPYGLEPNLWSGIQSLNKISPFGPDTVTVGSGWRSYEEQAKLYDDWINGVPGQARAAPPGQSHHNDGTAADLQFLSPEAEDWVHKNAESLGLHFPVSGEGWHIELIS